MLRPLARWLRTWGALVVAVAALGISVYVACAEQIHFTQLTLPHTRHDEVRDRLYRLDERIERAERCVQAAQSMGEGTADSTRALQVAIDLRWQAEAFWDDARYDEAETAIEDAYDALEVIPSVAVFPMYWWLVSVVLALVLVSSLSVVAGFFWKRRRVEGDRKQGDGEAGGGGGGGV
ncbi:MAG: hypothetical protein SVP26_07585 [Chloroflexota bacterium]|nr:hypothetical protein [Chloroflexota bacterium]